MMDIKVWIPFFMACWVISITPGAGALICMNRGALFGARKTLFVIIGLEFGSLILALIASIGLGTVLLASNFSFFIIKVMGAFYLIYIGVSQWNAPIKFVEEKLIPESLHSTWPYKFFLTGFLTNLTNPKGIIFMVAMLPQFINEKNSVSSQLSILLGTMIAVDFSVMYCYALLSIKAQFLLKNPKARQLQNRLMGSILIFIGLTLFFVHKSPN